MQTENIIRRSFFLVALTSIIFLAGILVTLVVNALPALREIGLGLFTTTHWYPTAEPPEFGVIPLIAASLWITAGALLFSVPLGILFSLFLSEVLPEKIKAFLKPTVELLANIPSVVYGFFGMVFLAPLVMRLFHLPVGLNGLTASIVLGIMALPTITSVCEDSLNAVPRTYREASLALGATKWETMIHVTLPAAASGVSAAVVLGLGRAIGETMTVLMVAGGAAVIPRSLLQPMRPITANIAAEMGEAAVGGLHYQSLFALALFLLIITLFINQISDTIVEKSRQRFKVQ
ncbi:MAG: phosphate ABC transporter permease subunit PstC [Candidatus Omnitrophota bacterium]|nr:phosphate ABC transporter permease subunit PstC [Candidatus Omnitrophota bacterium]